jgi:hypothetical protein
MRIVLLLVVVAIIGIAIGQLLSRKPPEPVATHSAASGPAPPTVPTRPQDVKTFEQDMGRFMQDAAKQQGNKDAAP